MQVYWGGGGQNYRREEIGDGIKNVPRGRVEITGVPGWGGGRITGVLGAGSIITGVPEGSGGITDMSIQTACGV